MEEEISLYEELLRDYIQKRVIIFNEDIDDTCLESVSLRIIKWNQEDKDIPVEKRKPIWLYLQSGGGNTVSGFNLIDVISSSQTPVYAVCFSVCASMAFHLFISAHKRYAFKNSVLLIHDGELAINNSTSKVKDTMDFVDAMESRIKNHVLQYTKITPEKYDDIYEKEYYMYADEDGKILGCVDYIIGEDVQLDEIL